MSVSQLDLHRFYHQSGVFQLSGSVLIVSRIADARLNLALGSCITCTAFVRCRVPLSNNGLLNRLPH
jgi:hypothetical protein